jgi:hypothetical protein
MLGPVLLLMLTAAPVKIAVSGFTVSGGIDPASADAWAERFAEVMRRSGRVEVTTRDDIGQLLGLERQRQLLGCNSEGSSCIAELANALGADGVLVGTFTRTGDAYLVVVRVLRQPSGAVGWSASSRVTGEAALLDWLDEQAAACAETLAPTTRAPRGPFIVGGIGAGVAIAGAALLVVANTEGVRAVRQASDEPALSSALSAGRAEATAGAVLIGVGAAAAATAVLWGLLGRESAPVAIAPVSGGAIVGIRGEW